MKIAWLKLSSVRPADLKYLSTLDETDFNLCQKQSCFFDAPIN